MIPYFRAVFIMAAFDTHMIIVHERMDATGEPVAEKLPDPPALKTQGDIPSYRYTQRQTQRKRFLATRRENLKLIRK